MKAKENKEKIGIGTVLKTHSILLDKPLREAVQAAQIFAQLKLNVLYSFDW
jgi:hypothetical protein